MNYILIIAVVFAGFGFLLVLYKLFAKSSKKILKLPRNHVVFFFIYAILGLSGFLFHDQHVEYPRVLASVLFLVSITGGLWLTVNMYEKWEWAQEATLLRKVGFIGEMVLVSMIAFAIAFILSEHRGMPKSSMSNDLVWWLLPIILLLFLPIAIVHIHTLWNAIPRRVDLKHIFQLPLEKPPPFIETGGASLNFFLVVPLSFKDKDTLDPKRLAVPYDQSLGDVFHYVVHDHNVVKRFPKKIMVAEENRRNKLYGWTFYRTKKIWWGYMEKKYYLNPKLKVGNLISDQEWIYVQREKIWEQ